MPPETAPSMPGFSEELSGRIIGLMLRIDQFNSDASLRAMFITTDLADLRPNIPEATSKYDRAHKVMIWLAGTGKKEKVLAFLQTLEGRYQEGDGLKKDLQKLIADINAK